MASDVPERLVVEDFKTPSPTEAFDPVAWLNARLARSHVPFDKLDQHLSSLGMSCQLLCQDTSEAIELASNQLVAQLSTSSRGMEKMRQEALSGHARMAEVLEGLKDADDKKRASLKGLAEIDAVKTRVETALSALREVNSWDRKVKDCEQFVHSGNLREALSQLRGLGGVLDAFRMLPEFGRKEEQLKQLEEQLLAAARRRGRAAVEKSVVEELKACREVFAGMNRQEETAAIAVAVFLDLAERAWANQAPGAGASAAELAKAGGAVLDSLVQALAERGALLQVLDAPDEQAEAGSQQSVTISVVKAVLGAVGAHVQRALGDGRGGSQVDEATAHARSSTAVALLAVYVDGFAALAPSPALEGRWPEVCRVSDTEVEVLPWSLLREVVRFVLLRPMEDDAASLAPPSRALRPSEAVLAAESNATRLLALPSTWARRLETQRAAQLAVPWLACVDEANAAYWRSWDRLIDTFANTLKAKSAEAAATDSSGYDPNFLQEVMQLHAMLHDTLPAKFSSFQAEVLKQAGQLHSSQLESPFSRALKEKMKDPEVWCEQLGIPSLPALKAASDLMDGVGIGSFDSGRAVLPAASAALAAAETKVRGVVTRCCAEPVSNILRGYPEMQEWSREGPGDEVSHGPLQCITLVPEHLFSLIPQLEKSQESSQLQWLPAVLEAAVEVVVQKVLQIKQLTPAGVVQLCVDLDYLRKVPEALGNSGETSAEKSTGAAARLRELLETLEFLGAQLQRKRESAAQGAAFSEEPRPPGAARWPEKALRSAMGL